MLNDTVDVNILIDTLSSLHLDVIPYNERVHQNCSGFRDNAWDRIVYAIKLYSCKKILTNVSRLTGDIRDWVSVRTPTPEDLENMEKFGVYYLHTLGRFGNE